MSELSICEKRENVDIPREGMALVFALEKSMEGSAQFIVKSYNNFDKGVADLNEHNKMLWFVIQGILAMTNKEPNALMYRGIDEFRKFFENAGLSADATGMMVPDIHNTEVQGHG